MFSVSAFATEVTMETPFGDVQIELFDAEAPATVANFLNYVNSGAYKDSFIHRSVPGFVIQGGGYYLVDGNPAAIETNAPVVNEPGISNTRGTIAMAKQEGNPDSATSQWFFNLADNSDPLDNSNGGFTVFGQVLGNGMDVIDQIADLQVWGFAPPFSELPLIDYPGIGDVTDENLVMIDMTAESDNSFAINPGLNDAWYNPDTDGQGFFIIVFPDIELLFLSWFTYDTERPDDGVTAILGDPGHRWLTAQGNYAGNEAALDITISSGGIFDSGVPVPTQAPDGTMTVTFNGCNSGTVAYDIPSIGRQGVVPIQRVALDNVALCEALNTPAAQ
ncbi:MAG: hypothetical protein HKN57_14525 [Xanthomonadales bacterium]|nr:peptidylprolyl isomerase [Gammaproteobacteria bacterium]NND58459.1 hypothetical protein [Xanthomonadales bacterium]NNK50120.1 hypothetical protein [Xanthomonadales bacterium]